MALQKRVNLAATLLRATVPELMEWDSHVQFPFSINPELVMGSVPNGAYAGSIVSQGLSVAFGYQDKFSWKQVAAAALGSILIWADLPPARVPVPGTTAELVAELPALQPRVVGPVFVSVREVPGSAGASREKSVRVAQMKLALDRPNSTPIKIPSTSRPQ